MTEQKENIQKEMAVGAVWMTVLRFSYRFIGLVSTIILARLLTPDDFGVAAIAMSIFALISTFTQFGFETVLIQRKNPGKDHYNTAWSFNVMFGLVSALLLAAASEFIGSFYNNRDLTYVALATSLLFVLHGFRNIGVVDFQKNMTFDKEFRLHVIPKFISFFVTIALAIMLKSYWALVVGNLVWKTMEVLASYIMHPFRPRICFKKTGDLFGFSKWLLLNNMLTFLNTKSPELALGKILSPHAAAIFTLASEISQMTTTEIVANLNRAIYPGYSKAARDISKLRGLFKDSIRVIAFIAMPLGTGVALVSPFIVPLLLGEQWLEAVEPVVYLALGGSIYALKSNANYVYFALGKPKFSTIELFVRALIFLPSMFYLMGINGVVGAAQSFLLTSVCTLFVSNTMLKFVLGIPFYRLFGLYLRPLLATLVMAASVGGYLHYLAVANIVLDLLLSVLIGVASYTLSVFIIWYTVGDENDVEKKITTAALEKLRR